MHRNKKQLSGKGGNSVAGATHQIDRILDSYFDGLNGRAPRNLHKIIVGHIEKRLIKKTLERAGENKSEAARMLGLSRNTLRTKLSQYKDPHRNT